MQVFLRRKQSGRANNFAYKKAAPLFKGGG
jgi:hypothetical protein